MDIIIALIEKISNKYDVPFPLVILILVSALMRIITFPRRRKMHINYIIERNLSIERAVNSIKILKPEHQKIAHDTLIKFGFKKQIMKAIEELSELNVELAKYCNSIDLEKSASKIISELADVHICLFQICLIFGEIVDINEIPITGEKCNTILIENKYDEKKSFKNTISDKEINFFIQKVSTLNLYLSRYYTDVEENRVKNNYVMIFLPLIEIYEVLEKLIAFFGKDAVLKEIDFKIERQEERNERSD